MNISDIYAYLCRHRRDLWGVLEGAPDEVLSRPVITGERFHCVKDLIFHIPMIEDSWVHEDFLRDQPVWEAFAWIDPVRGDGPVYAQTPLADLLEYWRAVEERTLKVLPALTTPQELSRPVVLGGPDGQEATALDGLWWHVLVHEMRHSAQVSLLLRLAGVTPPVAGVLHYLPVQPVAG